MSKRTDDRAAVEFPAPLQRRTRTAEVTAELAALSEMPRSAVLRRASEADAGRRLRRETLVAVVRAFERAGDRSAGDHVLEALIKRVSGTLTARIGSWHGLTPEDRTDCGRQMVVHLCEEVRTLTPGAELWEGNFTTCLNRRLITVWHGWNDRRLPTVSRILEHADGSGYDTLEQAADTRDLFDDVEVAALVQMLTPSHPKMAEALFLRMSGYLDEEIAVRLDVTSRTLRNWTIQARRAWEREAIR